MKLCVLRTQKEIKETRKNAQPPAVNKKQSDGRSLDFAALAELRYRIYPRDGSTSPYLLLAIS
jgi:hypothetical protein